MMKIKLPALCTVAVAALALAACTEKQGGGLETGMELAKVSGMAPTGSAFDRALFTEYLSLSRSEYNQGDYADSDRYAGRARFAARANSAAPQNVSGRKLPGDKVAEINASYERLIAALAAGAPQRVPADAAHAQVMFDCWLEQQEENRQNNDIAACRAGFLAALAKIEVPPVAFVLPAVAPRPESYTVYFDFNQSALNDKARDEVARIVSRARAMNAKSVEVDGYADRSGSGGYNQRLSQKRAAAVRDAIRVAGVNASIDGRSYGESRPATPTADGMREGANRRVVVTVKP